MSCSLSSRSQGGGGTHGWWLRLGRAGAVISLVLAAASATAGPVIEAPAGTVEGAALEGVSVYRGIPFAEAPVGNLRWKPPVGKARWDGVRDATRFGPICHQPEFPNVPANIYYEHLPAMSEDCLSLSIWKPDGAQNLPVFVWIHGGSLLTGAGTFPMYDGARLARQGMIVVAINYRLGALGFMAHPELSAESPENISGNYGLLDQIAALRWVERNIAAFGGDPDNVTIAGESAGALSIMNLMTAPPAQGLFDKAIMQSAYMVSQPHLREARHGHTSAESEGLRLADALGAETLSELRAASAAEITKRATALGFRTWITVDDKIIPHQLPESFDRGVQARVPILAGFNSGEIRSLRMLLPSPQPGRERYEREIRESYGELADIYLKIYPADTIEESLLQAVRDGLYGWTTQRLAMSQTSLGAPAWLYLFDHGYRAADRAGLHAFHGAELPYVFGTIGETGPNWPRIPDTQNERALSDAMLGYWASFAKTGRPVAEGAPDWPHYSSEEPWMVFADTPRIAKDVLGLRYEINEAVVCRRRAAGDQQWNWNVSIAAPPLPPRVEPCR